MGNDIKLTSGRIFVPLYRDLFRSDVTLPWLLALLQPEPETWLNICRSDFATNLPDFPDKDCMQLYEGVLVVKFSDD